MKKEDKNAFMYLITSVMLVITRILGLYALLKYCTTLEPIDSIELIVTCVLAAWFSIDILYTNFDLVPRIKTVLLNAVAGLGIYYIIIGTSSFCAKKLILLVIFTVLISFIESLSDWTIIDE